MRESAGLVGNVRGLASDGVRMVRTRLELFAIELQEERAHAVRQIVIASATLYLLTFGTLLAIIAIGLAVPEGSREAVFATLAVIFLVLGGIGAYLASLTRNRTSFRDTIAVLGRDERALRGTGD